MRNYESPSNTETWSVEELQEKRVISLAQLNPSDPSKTSASNIILPSPPLHCKLMHFEVPVAASSCYWWWLLLWLLCFYYSVYDVFDGGVIDLRNTLKKQAYEVRIGPLSFLKVEIVFIYLHT
jgi:hypothetical protein